MSQSAKKETRKRLIEAGKKVIFEKGFHRARVSDITSEAGLAHGTFYLYFKTKDDFLLELLKAVRGEMLSLIDDGIKQIRNGDREKGKELVFLKTFELMIREKELAKIFFFEAICTSKEFQEFYREGKELFISRIDEALFNLGVPSSETKAHILVGCARHLIENLILSGGEVFGIWKEILRELGIYS